MVDRSEFKMACMSLFVVQYWRKAAQSAIVTAPLATVFKRPWGVGHALPKIGENQGTELMNVIKCPLSYLNTAYLNTALPRYPHMRYFPLLHICGREPPRCKS